MVHHQLPDKVIKELHESLNREIFSRLEPVVVPLTDSNDNQFYIDFYTLKGNYKLDTEGQYKYLRMDAEMNVADLMDVSNPLTFDNQSYTIESGYVSVHVVSRFEMEPDSDGYLNGSIYGENSLSINIKNNDKVENYYNSVMKPVSRVSYELKK